MNYSLLVQPKRRVPLWVRIGTKKAEKLTGKVMIVPSILAWYEKAAFSSGILEALVSHGEGKASGRLLQLIRIQISMQVESSFCVDVNLEDHKKNKITQEELSALGDGSIQKVETFSREELAALKHTRNMTQTPAIADSDLALELQQIFNERELVIISTTIAQLNYWTRLNKGLGLPVAAKIGS